jgi:hypothetical protein
MSWGSSWTGFGKQKRPTEPEMLAFAEYIAAPLNVQLDLAARMLGQEGPNPRALGYVYGWTDAFLQVRGWDMADKASVFQCFFTPSVVCGPVRKGRSWPISPTI